jgi:hypothetical protein
MPVFAFTTPYSGTGATSDLWNYSTVRMDDSMSPEDNSVIYSYVKRTNSGAGSTQYEFITPATAWDGNASPDWSPSLISIARANCVSSGFIINDKNTYPFPPNINFEFERGLCSKVTNFDENGNEVSESAFTYQRTGSPAVIYALKFDYNLNAMAYSKYAIYASTGELRASETKKVFDQSNLSQVQQTTTNYYYSSAQHKYPTQQQATNSDGSVVNNFTKYSKDYSVSLGSDSTSNGIYHLQKLNINTPIEQYVQLSKGGTTVTTGASLIKFNTFNPTGNSYLYLPCQKLKFVSVNGVANFQSSSVSGAFNYDYRYIPV